MTPSYDGNDALRSKAENLLLNLFASHSLNLKRLVYKLASEKVAYFFSSIMNGRAIPPKYRSKKISESNFFGLPINGDALNEIISDGLSSSDPQIRSSAENIVTIILRSRRHLQAFENEINAFLIPAMPLLLCYSSRKSALGRLFVYSSPTHRLVQSTIHKLSKYLRVYKVT